jgi:hypothetical protein
MTPAVRRDERPIATGARRLPPGASEFEPKILGRRWTGSFDAALIRWQRHPASACFNSPIAGPTNRGLHDEYR